MIFQRDRIDCYGDRACKYVSRVECDRDGIQCTSDLPLGFILESWRVNCGWFDPSHDDCRVAIRARDGSLYRRSDGSGRYGFHALDDVLTFAALSVVLIALGFVVARWIERMPRRAYLHTEKTR